MAQKSVLGKGLASLLPNANLNSALQANLNPNVQGSSSSMPPSSKSPASSGITSKKDLMKEPVLAKSTPENSIPSTAFVEPSAAVTEASLTEIRVNPLQPRRDFDPTALQELAQSIRENGIIQPLVVRKLPSLDGYELIAGERRLRAAKLAGLKQVPIVIRTSTNRESLELALIENIQRQDLNCIDAAIGYFQLIQDFALTQEDVATRVGKDRATVANHLRLLRLPEQIIEDLKKQVLTFGHGKALLGLDDAEQRMRARALILERGMSVREAEALVDSMKKAREAGAPIVTGKEKGPMAQRLSHLAQDLTRQWSTKVELKGSERKGKIVIHYSSRKDLDRILEGMQNKGGEGVT